MESSYKMGEDMAVYPTRPIEQEEPNVATNWKLFVCQIWNYILSFTEIVCSRDVTACLSPRKEVQSWFIGQLTGKTEFIFKALVVWATLVSTRRRKIHFTPNRIYFGIVSCYVVAQLTTTCKLIWDLTSFPTLSLRLWISRSLASNMNFRNQMSNRSQSPMRAHKTCTKPLLIALTFVVWMKCWLCTPISPILIPVGWVLKETMVSSTLDTSHLQFPNYSLPSGFFSINGSCAYIHWSSTSSWPSHPEFFYQKFQFIRLEIRNPSFNHFLCTIYRSPNSIDPLIFEAW